MFDRLEAMVKRYNELNNLLATPEVATDIKKLTELSKEAKDLEDTVNLYLKYRELESQLPDLNEMLEDDDLEVQEMARAEIAEIEESMPKLVEELELLLVPKDPNDDKNVIIEIKGAAGGDEANIFAGDLYRMYLKYAETKGWKIETLNLQESAAGGFSQIEFMMSGDKVYSFMKFESGTHRVQRVPATESQGRVHTSTATVIVLPEIEELDFELDMNEVRVDTFCSSGPGGQSVNTTKSAVRLTHVPTGIVVSCQDGKSQHGNKDKALKILKARINDKYMQEKLDKEGAERKALVGRGDRSEKVRTYNYPQNRITDHRIGFTIQQLDRVIEGKLDPVITALINEDQKMKLLKQD